MAVSTTTRAFRPPTLFALIVIIFVGAFFLQSASAQFEDFRCKCICPSLEVVNATDSGRMVYIEAVTPENCNCRTVVNPPEKNAKEFCPRCDCHYETRNTKTIQVVIIIIICVVSMLVVYMVFLLCLDPLMGRKSAAYAEQRDEADEPASLEGASVAGSERGSNVGLGGAEGGRRGSEDPLARRRESAKNVLSRVGMQQDKWKQQVQEQRHAVFDRQTMLN